MNNDFQTVVLDYGTALSKVGFAGGETPKYVFPTIFGTSKLSSSDKPCFGREAEIKKDVLSLRRPIEHGVITDWNLMEKIYQYTYSEVLKVESKEHPLILSESNITQKVHREKLTQLVFENLNVPAFYLSKQAVLSLLGSGKTTGIVLDSGDGTTTVVPIYNGFALEYSMSMFEPSGRDVTDYLMKLIGQSNQFSSFQRPDFKDIKHKLCYVALDYDQELVNTSDSPKVMYDLPDGSQIGFGSELFKSTEIYFQPKLLEMGVKGIDHIICDSIKKSDSQLSSEFYGNIVLSGGSTLLKGFHQRLQLSIEKLAPTSTNVKICSDSQREYLSWIGGSILGTLSNFNKMCISKTEYDENGPSIINKWGI